ncbi:MAG: M48 family metalloprotease [Inquilinus limosus]|uniref:M48 family metalloprotease n=1 Tax=Inquilinus limosus TaxID=171674 RepID=A0A952FLA6_9PROT|nr:M48 family metalloprotease [Inquilinus limosus]
MDEDEALDAFGGIFRAPVLRDRVAAIGQRIVDAEAGGALRVSVELLDSERVNAAAGADGRILVTRGLLALARSEAELAFVLAHEVGHVVAGHARQRAERPAGTTGEAGFDRAQELEADRIGLSGLARAGYDPAAAVAFLARLDAWHRLDAALVGRPELALAATNGADHPEMAERIAAARIQAAALPRGETGEAAWLDAIDGLPWGERPGQIAFRGRSVIDPVAQFRWEAPPGVVLSRRRKSVLGSGPDGSVIVFDHGAGALPARPALDQWGEAIGGVREIEAGILGGLRAAWGLARPSDGWEAVLAVIETAPDRRERFLVLTRSGSPVAAAMRRAIGSVRRIDAAEAAAVRPRRLAMVPMQRRDTVAGLVGRMRVEAAEAWFRLLNDVPGDALPASGARVKLIVE